MSMSTRDGCASPCATSAWRVWRAGAATHSLVASLALGAALVSSPARLGAQAYYNLDAGRPTRVEDATPTPRDELDVQLPAFRYDQLASGARLWRADSKLSYGVAALTE